jgi:hypothetical protein
MKKPKFMALAGALLLGSAAPAAPNGSTAPSIAWMSGTWVTETAGRWTEERWAPPRAGVLLGTSLSGRGNRAESFEFLRIAADENGKVSYWGSPEGATPVAFALVRASRNELVFENPSHDFPTRIAYRRNGNILTATVSGPGGKDAQSWRYRRR